MEVVGLTTVFSNKVEFDGIINRQFPSVVEISAAGRLEFCSVLLYTTINVPCGMHCQKELFEKRTAPEAIPVFEPGAK
jgi:hypothetical protein